MTDRNLAAHVRWVAIKYLIEVDLRPSGKIVKYEIGD